MTAYGTVFFSMNDVNRLRILRMLSTGDSLRVSRPAGWRFLTDTADGYWSATVNMDRFHLLTVGVASLATGN